MYLGLYTVMILELTSLRTCVSNSGMPAVISFWTTLMFYLMAIRFHVSTINNIKMLLTSLKKIIMQQKSCSNNQLSHQCMALRRSSSEPWGSLLRTPFLTDRQTDRQLRLWAAGCPSQCQCAILTLAVLAVLVARDGVHAVSRGAVGWWAVGLGCGQAV